LTGLFGGAGFSLTAKRVFLGLARVFAGLPLSGLTLLLKPGLFDNALAGLKLFGRQVQIGLKRRTDRPWLRGPVLRNGALFRLDGRRGRGRTLDPPTLGLYDHRLGAAMAKALLYCTRTHSPNPGLESQGRTATGGRCRWARRAAWAVIFIVVRVVHPLALLISAPRTGPAFIVKT
jgi:hypothetical protein